MKKFLVRIWSVAVLAAPIVVGVLIGSAVAGETSRAGSAVGTASAPQALDLETLADRLRETDAVDLITKLAIEREVMDLARAFQRYHEGDAAIGLYKLRERFEVLRAGIAVRLKNGDPVLAGDIAVSGATLWQEFRDPVRFTEGIGSELVATKSEFAGDISY